MSDRRRPGRPSPVVDAGPRWDLWLAAVAAVVAALLVALAALSAHAMAGREQLALEGRAARLAHAVEAALREDGMENAGEILDAELAAAGAGVTGLTVAELSGALLAESGSPGDRRLEVDLLVGPAGRPRERGGPTHRGGRGRLLLLVHLQANAGRPPLPVRLLTPAASAVGLALIVLAFAGGRLLRRQRADAARDARQRRLEALGRAGAGLAHQLRTPLATIKGSCQLLGEQLAGGPLAARLATVVGEAARMDRMLGQLLDFARPPKPEPRPLAVPSWLADAVGDRERVEVAREPEGVALADPDHLRQILDCLLDNAIALSPPAAPVEVGVRDRREAVEVVVADRGPGPGDDPEELFQPYVSHRTDGAGLGLTIARALAEVNGGSLRLAPRPGGGTEAILRLPRARESS